ncbi:MAG: hypothetical protein AB7E45_04335 [Candidatus Caldatribacteriota bacterium]
MTKQEYLAFSLPYRLKCFSNQTNAIYDITSMSFGNRCLVRVKPNNQRDFLLPTSRILPILRPLSDLTKEIEHKGEKFVPIVELAKIAEESNIKILDYKQKDSVFGVKYISEEGIECVFAFHEEGQAFAIHSINDRLFDICMYQLQLFQQVVKWHFDLFGGIESGEAIDVNALDINPYK